jgi:hypothetical protein
MVSTSQSLLGQPLCHFFSVVMYNEPLMYAERLLGNLVHDGSREHLFLISIDIVIFEALWIRLFPNEELLKRFCSCPHRGALAGAIFVGKQ